MENTARLFAKSFLYVFGLTDNPIKLMLKESSEIDDTEMIRKDWEMVGKDIINSYEYEISNGRKAYYSD